MRHQPAFKRQISWFANSRTVDLSNIATESKRDHKGTLMPFTERACDYFELFLSKLRSSQLHVALEKLWHIFLQFCDKDVNGLW
jgi:hypothetical protein